MTAFTDWPSKVGIVTPLVFLTSNTSPDTVRAPPPPSTVGGAVNRIIRGGDYDDTDNEDDCDDKIINVMIMIRG